MRKIYFISIVIVVMILTGCQQKKLFIYNWSTYTPKSVIESFEKKYDVKVVYDEFASNEEMFTKLKAGAKGYDITFPSGDYVSIMIKEKMLEALDKSQIPNMKNIDTEILSGIKFDQGNLYSVPYMKGASGITVNKKYVKNYKKDSSVFLRPELNGRFTLLDDLREVIGLALKANGYSVNSTNPDELQKAKSLIMKWHENKPKFDSDTFGKSFSSEEFWVVHGYQENVFVELDDKMKDNADFFIPEHGGPMYMDSMVILKDSKNKELAYKFINYIHEPEIYASFVDTFAFPCMNNMAEKYRKVKPRYNYSDLRNCEYKEDLGEKLELYNKLWQEIRIGK